MDSFKLILRWNVNNSILMVLMNIAKCLPKCAAALLALSILPLARAQQIPPNDSWAAIGPTNSTVFALQRDPFDGRVFYAGTYFGGMYRSIDAGTTWSHLPSPFSTKSVFTIELDPSRRGVLYAGTFQAGLFKSEDGGRTWIERNQGLQDLNVQAVRVNPANSNLVLMSNSEGIFRSTDGGATWTPSQKSDAPLVAKQITFDPRNPDIVYVATLGVGVYRSTNGGVNWTAFNNGMPAVNVLSLEFTKAGDKIYIATNTAVYKLELPSDKWQDITKNLTPYGISQVLPHPARNGFLFVVSFFGVFTIADDRYFDWTQWAYIPSRMMAMDETGSRIFVTALHGGFLLTTDFGKSFQPVTSGMQNLFIGALASSNQSAPSSIYAGSDEGVYYKASAAGDWKLGAGLNHVVFELQSHPSDPAVAFAGTEKDGVWKTSNGGQSWKQTSDGIVPPQIFSLAQSPIGQRQLYAATTSGLFLSLDDGANWVAGPAIAPIYTIAVDPSRKDHAYIGGAQGQVWRSTEGANFFLVSQGLPREDIISIKVADSERIYAVTARGNLYGSFDAGYSWFSARGTIPDEVTAVDVDPSSPNVMYVGTRAGGVYKSTNSGQDWSWMSDGIDIPFIFSVAVDPRTAGVVYAASLGRVFKTTDGAQTWSATGDGLPDGAITSLVIDPTTTNILFASVADRGVYRSDDAGATWTSASEGLPVRGTLPICLNSADPTSLYAGTTFGGIYASTNRGGNWSAASKGMSLFIRGIAIDKRNPSLMYASALVGGMFKSTDGGNSWSNIGLREKNVFKVAVSPQDSNIVYAATAQGVQRSRNGGETWESPGQKTAFLSAMVVDPRDRRVIYTGGPGGGIYKSKDGGQTWQFVSTQILSLNVIALTIDPVSNTLFASLQGGGVFKSVDGGSVWKATQPSAALYLYPSRSLVFDQSSGTLYAASSGGGVVRTTDGDSWEFANLGLANLNVNHIAMQPDAPKILLAATDGGVYKTVNGGLLWKDSSRGLPLAPAAISHIAISPRNSSILFASTTEGPFKSTDGGDSWVASNGGIEKTAVVQILFNPDDELVLYANVTGKGLFQSKDGGATWTPLYTGVTDIRGLDLGADGNTLLIASNGGGFVRSADGGKSWSPVLTPDLIQPFVAAIGVDAKNPDIVYAGTAGQGVLKTVNGGLEWQTRNKGIDHFFILAMAIDPEQTSNVYIGTTGGGVFATSDGGENWVPLRDGLFNQNITSLTIDANDRKVIYAGTEGGGVFKLRRP